MSTIVETSYFNSFLLKKAGIYPTNSNPAFNRTAIWPSLPWASSLSNYPDFPVFSNNLVSSEKDYSWYVEESRIRGGYNNTQTELGPRAYLSAEDNGAQVANNGIIFSGLFNSATGVNNTNVFSTAQNITKELDPRYGSIKKFYATDTDLRIFQELKVSRSLIDKDAIFTADGNPQLTASTLVVGQNLPFAGEYGIGDFPESFAKKGYRSYFVDNNKGVVCRLSKDGITEISQNGMRDYFRDQLNQTTSGYLKFGINASNVTTTLNGVYEFSVNSSGVKNLEVGMNFTFGSEIYTIVGLSDTIVNNTQRQVTIDKALTTNAKTNFFINKWDNNKIVGGYDMYQDTYTMSIQSPQSDGFLNPRTSETLTFDEQAKGWTSFYSYTPIFINSLNSSFYSTTKNQVWLHYDPLVARNSFYNNQYDSSITFLFNEMPSIKKNFLTVNYEGTNGWEVNSFSSGFTGPIENDQDYINSQDTIVEVKSLQDGYYVDPTTGQPAYAGFNLKENLYTANLVNNSTIAPGEVVNLTGGARSGIKAYYATVKISTDRSTEYGGVKELWAVGTTFVRSS
tara:strand:+ start:1299 stop:2996 length:1698 start_codon:yes stop_codon:yes gene_type:complete